MGRVYIYLLIFVSLLVLPVSLMAEEEGELIRLHVIANSDNRFDQEIKLKIRDLVLEKLSPLKNETTIDSAWEYLVSQEKELGKLIKGELAKNGLDYPVKIELKKSKFPTRLYRDKLVLPAGNYLALKIILGEGEGANWWCVLYPPLCYGDWIQRDEGFLVEEEGAVTALTNNTAGEKKEISGEEKLKQLKKIGQEWINLMLKVWGF